MSDTTTTSEPRPVSALEQTLRDKVERTELEPKSIEPQSASETEYRMMRAGALFAFTKAANLVHERDAQLWALLEKGELRESMCITDDAKNAYRYMLDGLHAILKGKTS